MKKILVGLLTILMIGLAVQDGVNGLIVDKDEKSIMTAVKRLYEDETLCENLAKNSRRMYEETYSLLSYGKNVGRLIQDRNLMNGKES